MPEPAADEATSAPVDWPGSSGRSITWAPALTAYLIPAAIASGSPDVTLASVACELVLSSVTWTDSSRAAGATPNTPSEFPEPWPWPTIRLAIAVPWIPANFEGLDPHWEPVMQSGPEITDPVRSACFGSTPVSSRAIVTPEP